jgi:sugar/nucleoside kinase (ribokinase family)
VDERIALLAVGEAMVDIVVDATPAAAGPEHVPIRLAAGGTPVNAALAAVALGASAAVLARVGDDAGAAATRHSLDTHGVQSLLAFDPARPTGVFLDVDGRIVAARGANDALAPADFAAVPAHDALLLSGYTFRTATAPTARTCLNTSSARWRAIDAGGVPDGSDLSSANVLLGTWEELREDGDPDPERLALRLLERYEVVAVKLGADGAVAAAGGRYVRLPAVLDASGGAVGAGDAFDAGLLVGLTRGLGIRGALELALAAAAGHIRARTTVTPL